MAKLSQNFAKYMIVARMTARGVVEKPDVVGAIFGQTEGLLGSDLELRDLQRTGRIGRIEVEVKSERGKSEAIIQVPSSLDAAETCLIAAALETIEKVGPCDAKISVEKVEDVRTQKRKYVISKAKELLKKLMENQMPNSEQLSEMIKEEVRVEEVSNYHGLPAGPNIDGYDEIIVVEGRADVVKLLKYGIKNVIAIEGSKIPQPIVELSKEKTVTAFIDGDRGGDLDLRKLLEVADIDYVARAPKGKEVEDLTKKEVFKSIRDKIPADIVRSSMKIEKHEEEKHENHERREEKEEHKDMKKEYLKMLDELIGTKAGYIINSKGELVAKFPLSELQNIVINYSDTDTLVLDTRIDQSIINLARHKNIRRIVCKGFSERVDTRGIEVITKK